MKNIWKKWMASILIGILFFNVAAVNIVKAENGQNEVVEEQGQSDAAVDGEEVVGDVLNSEENAAKELTMNYLYIGEPEQEVGATQYIVMSVEDASGQEISLTIEDESGNQTILQSVREENGLFLFENVFSRGIYHVVKADVVSSDTEAELVMDEMGISAYFGVDETVDESVKSDYVEVKESVDSDDDGLETTFITIDENDEIIEEEYIGEALAAQEQTEVESRSAESGADNLVIVLDPGHDSNHRGASGNGIYEEQATLKITQYCKEELDKYSGVTVYMTRTNADCPFPDSSNNIDDIKKRTAWAKTMGADVFISFHLNSSDSTSANGAEVYYPKGSGEGQELAEDIMSELEDIGLKPRGAKEDDSYAVITSSKQNGFPGLIIEHAFLSNTGDVNNYLKTDEGLKKLGVADAAGIAKHYNLSENTNEVSGWITDSNGNKYYYENGKPVKGEKCISGKWYYFDSKTGIMQTGFVDLGTKIVYYQEDGTMVYGEYKIDGKWYYFKPGTGAMQTGLVDLGSKIVYYQKDGSMAYGEVNIDGKWYYFKPGSGAMQTGFVDLGSKTVYYQADGSMFYGEIQVNSNWYYFKPGSGAMQTGLVKLEDKTAYYREDGTRASGEVNINGKWYYFAPETGAMQTGFVDLGSKTVYYQADGTMAYGEVKVDGKWYYFKPGSGAMQTGFVDLGSKTVYYRKDGSMAYGEVEDNGKWYYFKPGSGAMQTGFVKLEDKTAYYQEDGTRASGEVKIDGKWYYFAPETGAMQTGFVDLGSKTVYYQEDGTMAYGEVQVGDDWYYFSPGTGAMVTDAYVNGYYYGSDGKRQETTETPIAGKSSITIEKMVQAYHTYSPIEYPGEDLKAGGAGTVEELATIFYEEASAEGIRAEVAWAQSMLETGWLKFGGSVKISQYNFAGLGATDGSTSGADFSKYGDQAARMGVRAQIQHLKAYAVENLTKSDLKYECVDERFDYVSPKGCAKYVEWLGQQENPNGKGWATSEKYGYHIRDLMDKMLNL